MSLKTVIQIFISVLILLIISWVYFEYFKTERKIVEEINSSNLDLKKLEKKILDLELKNEKLSYELNKKITVSANKENKYKNNTIKVNEKKIEDKKIKNKEEKNEIVIGEKKKKVKNLIKDVEYTSIDQKGNKFYLLANSGKSNIENKDILDLNNVRGKITSEIRDTIYIVSDYAQYDTVNSNSKFYQNVIINYQNKQITCVNFDINMETNKAVAYNDVVIIDPKSIMKAGIVEFDLKTKDININPESSTTEIEVITN